MSLVPKIELLTIEAIRAVLEDMVEYKANPRMNLNAAEESTMVDISANLRTWDGRWTTYFTTEERNKYITAMCKALRREAEDLEAHASRIDVLLSSQLQCPVYVLGVQPGTFEDDFSRRAYEILKRIPPTPLGLIGAPANLDKGYFWEDETPSEWDPTELPGCGAWESLRVATSLSTSTIRIALFIVISGQDAFGQAMWDYPNAIAELLDACSDLTTESTSDAEHQQWYTVRAALWSSWQRSVMLYHYVILRDRLEKRLSGKVEYLCSTTPNPGLSVHEMSKLYAAHGKASYMCSWAFELLRTEPVSLGMDFRTFHKRYLQLWRNASARCLEGSSMPCEGKDPEDCWRFKGMVIKDQSAHDSECERRCRKLPWDERSYRSVSGARAVLITSAGRKDRNPRLKYCSASENTLAISHVWSHGQGGRPHIGVNYCLHQRYVMIAKQLGCNSYWWDSACIPEDHALRSEAIQNINNTFSGSKITLVCDRDLMSIDISNPTLDIKESILATVLVCDWNLRAWTFLESTKGRHNIHLLCRGNRTVSFLQIVRDVLNHGSIDLAILSFAVPHMLPESDHSPFMVKEEGGEVLSHRPASRKGDDIVIWSLLVSEDSYDSPEDLWRKTMYGDSGNFVHTGFLMSSAPRLHTKGLSWAPSTPYFKDLHDSSIRQGASFRAFHSTDTWLGIICDKGLLADWHVYEFNTLNIREADPHDSMLNDDQLDILTQICSLYLKDFVWGALLLPVSSTRTFEREEDTSVRYRGLILGTLMAILGTNGLSKPSKRPAEDRGWTWKGVFEWDKKVCLPKVVEESDFLIE